MPRTSSCRPRRRQTRSSSARSRTRSRSRCSRSNGGDLGSVGRSRLDPGFAGPVFAAKVGSIIEVHSSFGWHVVHVIAHQRTSLADATPQLRNAILQPLSQQRVTVLLDSIAHQLRINVNPRYGVWSIKDRAVNEPRNDLSKPVATPTPAPTLPTGAQPQPPSGG